MRPPRRGPTPAARPLRLLMGRAPSTQPLSAAHKAPVYPRPRLRCPINPAPHFDPSPQTRRKHLSGPHPPVGPRVPLPLAALSPAAGSAFTPFYPTCFACPPVFRAALQRPPYPNSPRPNPAAFFTPAPAPWGCPSNTPPGAPPAMPPAKSPPPHILEEPPQLPTPRKRRPAFTLWAPATRPPFAGKQPPPNPRPRAPTPLPPPPPKRSHPP